MSQDQRSCSSHHTDSSAVSIVCLKCDSLEPKLPRELNRKLKKNSAKATGTTIFIYSKDIKCTYRLVCLVRFYPDGAHYCVLSVNQRYISTEIELFFVVELGVRCFHVITQVFAFARKVTTLI